MMRSIYKEPYEKPDLERIREALIRYLKAKVRQKDWHGVSDAANDLRVLEKEIEVRGQ